MRYAFLLPAALVLVAGGMDGRAASQVAPPRSQPPAAPRACLHGDGETAAETTRRTEALAAMRMIDEVLGSFPGLRSEAPGWQELVQSTGVKRLQGQPGAVGDLARKIRWGSSEPLPGWGIAYVPGRIDARYALTDLRDPCGFTYSSGDPDVIPPNRGRLVPLTD